MKKSKTISFIVVIGFKNMIVRYFRSQKKHFQIFKQLYHCVEKRNFSNVIDHRWPRLIGRIRNYNIFISMVTYPKQHVMIT